ncbi:MAG: hypothetical protein H5T71_10275 [Chloroflexi bacterium]|nr:hypothetical protein [Chloroflexota bacterium]MBC7255929.1 hypothetical protein [Chloroflexota bacterium]
MRNTDWTPEIAYALERYNDLLREAETSRLAASARQERPTSSFTWILQEAVKGALCAFEPLQETNLCTVPNAL